MMTEEQAIAVAERERGRLGIDPAMEPASAEKVILEYKKRPSKPGRCEDRVAWIVTLSSVDGFVEVHLDDRTGRVLGVRRSA